MQIGLFQIKIMNNILRKKYFFIAREHPRDQNLISFFVCLNGYLFVIIFNPIIYQNIGDYMKSFDDYELANQCFDITEAIDAQNQKENVNVYKTLSGENPQHESDPKPQPQEKEFDYCDGQGFQWERANERLKQDVESEKLFQTEKLEYSHLISISETPQALFQNVFSDGEKEKCLKNGNLPKFISRMLIQRGEDYLHYFDGDINLENQFKKFISKEKQMIRSDKNRNNKIKDLIRIFGTSGQAKKIMKKSFVLRQIMNRIISQNLTDYVLLNPQVKLQREYMKALKVYRLRCHHKTLMERLESR